MRLIVFLSLFIISINADAQTADSGTKSLDSLRLILKAKLNTELSTIDKALGYIEQSAIDISAIMKDTTLSKDQKVIRMKQAAAKRDQKIAAILSPVQITQLKEDLKARKYRIRSARIGTRPNLEQP